MEVDKDSRRWLGSSASGLRIGEGSSQDPGDPTPTQRGSLLLKTTTLSADFRWQLNHLAAKLMEKNTQTRDPPPPLSWGAANICFPLLTFMGGCMSVLPGGKLQSGGGGSPLSPLCSSLEGFSRRKKRGAKAAASSPILGRVRVGGSFNFQNAAPTPRHNFY